MTLIRSLHPSSLPPWCRAAWFKYALAVLVALALAGAAEAQSISDAQLSAAEKRIEDLSARAKVVRDILAPGSLTDFELQSQKDSVESLKLDIAAEVSKLRGPLSETQAQIDLLGPPPEQGQVEGAAIAAQRRILATRSAQLAAEQKQLELLNRDADQNLANIIILQREQFFGRIFKPDRSILNPRLWLDTLTGLASLVTGIGRTVQDASLQSSGINYSGLLLFPLGASLLYGLWLGIRRTFGGWFERTPASDGEQLPALGRLWRVGTGLVALALILFAGLLLFFAALDASGLMTSRLRTILDSFAGALISITFATGFCWLLCSPRRPEARLIAIDDRSARLLPLLVGGAAVAFEFGSTISDISDTLQLPLTALPGQSALSAGAMIVLIGMMIAVLQRQARNNQAEGRSYFLTWFTRFFPILWILLGIAALALVLGYIALSYFIAGNLLQTGLFLVAMALVHNFADALADTMQNPISRIGQFLRRFSALGEVGIARLALLFRTGIDIVILIVSLPALFLIWAVTWINMSSFTSWVFNGFTIGNITLSPWGLVIAGVVLALGIVVTRALTNWLQRRVLSETTLDKGVQDSVRTGTSYLGYIIAAAVALSAAGLDFSNVAIVAGALGVGIGFGLQSIVNNFVSGLILLAERPVRVGDWVATNDGEGIVKKINVRSTEIETFDNCTVIVPNSALITGAVRNWTHRDSVGRFGISLMVAPESDPQKVADVLREAARAHPKVLRYPEAQVQLTRFPLQGLEFEVKGHVADVFEAARVASDIRFAIAAALKKNKIKMAVP